MSNIIKVQTSLEFNFVDNKYNMEFFDISGVEYFYRIKLVNPDPVPDDGEYFLLNSLDLNNSLEESAFNFLKYSRIRIETVEGDDNSRYKFWGVQKQVTQKYSLQDEFDYVQYLNDINKNNSNDDALLFLMSDKNDYEFIKKLFESNFDLFKLYNNANSFIQKLLGLDESILKNLFLGLIYFLFAVDKDYRSFFNKAIELANPIRDLKIIKYIEKLRDNFSLTTSEQQLNIALLDYHKESRYSKNMIKALEELNIGKFEQIRGSFNELIGKLKSQDFNCLILYGHGSTGGFELFNSQKLLYGNLNNLYENNNPTIVIDFSCAKNYFLNLKFKSKPYYIVYEKNPETGSSDTASPFFYTCGFLWNRKDSIEDSHKLGKLWMSAYTKERIDKFEIKRI